MTTPAAPGGSIDRSVLASANHDVVAGYARALAEHGSGHEVVVVVSNPVEVGVAVMAKERAGTG